MRAQEIPDKFIDVWKEFLRILHREGKKRAGKLTNRNKVVPISKLLDDLIDRLLKDDALDAVRSSIFLTENEISEFLIREIEYYVDCYTDENSIGADDDPVGDGEIVKKSVEDVIDKLPNWLKKLLKILNEILKLLSGST